MNDLQIPSDLQQMFEDSKLDTKMFVGSDIRTLIMRVAQSEQWASKLSAELDKGDSWAWIRGKFEKCRTQFKWHTPRADSLAGTRYEVMGWLHVLFAHADPQVYIDITIEHQKRTDEAEAKLAQIEQQWETWGIVEIAVRNPNVSEYMNHWEGRATKAEEALSRKEYYDSMRSREIDMAQIPESQKRFVSALLNQRDDSYRKMEESKQENDKLRGLLAQGKGDCVYCGLPAADISKCPHGFPGCSRMDDIVNAPETPKDEEIIRLRFLLSKLRDFTVQFVRIEMTNGKLYEMLAEELDGRKPEPTL